MSIDKAIEALTHGARVWDALEALKEAKAARDRLAAEVEALRADAERLDFIASHARCDPTMDGQHVWWPTSFNQRLTGPTLRAAIDAAKASGA